jgi:hypothetical protein
MDQRGNLLKELKIYNFPDSTRVRIGSDKDGGYVLLNNGLDSIDVVYSYGVGGNSDFEAMFCEKYNTIARLYDHTVDSAALQKMFLYFKKEGVGPSKTEDRNTIENHLNENVDSDKNLLLKMDIDGGEWDTLLHTPDSVLDLFSQIVIEVHGIGTDFSESLNGGEVYSATVDKKIKVLKKMNKLFYLYHAHANNYSRVFYNKWYKIPDTLELTYINKKIIKSVEPSKVIFPTEFDRPNNKNTKEVDLHFWPFYPGIIEHLSDIVHRKGWRSVGEISVVIFNQIDRAFRSIRTAIGLRRP